MKYLKQSLKPEQLKSYQYQIYAKGSEYLLETSDESIEIYQSELSSEQLGILPSSEQIGSLASSENNIEAKLVDQPQEKLVVSKKTKELDSVEGEKGSIPVSSILESLKIGQNENDDIKEENHNLIRFDKCEDHYDSITLESGVWKKKSAISSDIDILFLGDPTAESIKEAEVDLEGPYFELLLKISSATKIPLKKFGFIQQISEGESQFSQANYLANFLANTKPKFIVTLGAQAFQFMSNSKSRLSSVHGKKTSVSFMIEEDKEIEISVLPTFHPEYILINPKIKKTVWEDLQVLINSFL